MTYDTNSPTIHHSALFQPRNRRLLLIAGGLLLLAVIIIVIIAASRNATIFPVSINGKIGYINPARKVVIPPQFADAGRLSHDWRTHHGAPTPEPLRSRIRSVSRCGAGPIAHAAGA